MKKLLLVALLILVCCTISAQDKSICGKWVYHYPGYYVDGEEIWPKQDRYLRTDEIDGNLQVSIKYGKNGEFWGYSEYTNVQFNKDGSLMFNEHYYNRVKHDNGITSHCYTQYRAWTKGHTLQVKPLHVSLWYDRNGNLYGQSEQEERPDAICVYYNEKIIVK